MQQNTLQHLLDSFEIKRIADVAVRKAQDELRKKGIPLVYSLHGKIFYELPDGTITDVQPEMYKNFTPPTH
ncbi:MAG: hypothetical protein MUF71_19285 [Candidatus Kapabacteria bacterium]|jgi:hypothetical protein|nr:hypothetical protein [Candidatus Kapabacteria bacterium]